MGIKVVYEDNLFCPKIYCDICGKQLVGENGRYAYKWEDKDTKSVDIYILCGVRCHDYVEDGKHNTRLLWMPIKYLMVNLWTNLGFEVKDFDNHSRLMERLNL